MKCLTLTIVTVVYVILLCLSSLGFTYLEGRREDDERTDLSAFRDTFLANNTCVTSEELDELAAAIIKAYDAGVTTTSETESASNWDFMSSLFFCTTVSTTIGYGNISPVTHGGRTLCAIFALIGIPLCLVLLSGLADRLKWLGTNWVERMDSCKPESKGCHTASRVLVCIAVSLLMIFLPAMVFTLVEKDWNYGDSIYYCIITMTTVGFGDYVPAVGDGAIRGVGRAFYRLFTNIWILWGLAIMASTIGYIQEIMAKKVKTRELKIADNNQVKEAESMDGEKDKNVPFSNSATSA